MSNLIAPTPAFRQVDSNGNLVAGPWSIGINSDDPAWNGVLLKECEIPQYKPLVYGPVVFADFSMAPLLIGYRAYLSLQLTEIEAYTGSADSGLFMLNQIYTLSFLSDAYSAIEFNLWFGAGGGPWRGIQFSSGFAPRPMGGKWNEENRLDLDLDFYVRDIQQQVIDFGALSW